MSTGKDPKTMPAGPEYIREHQRIFGDSKPKRGRWIWDDAQQKLVSADGYRPPEKNGNGSIITDRWYEGTHALDPDRTDIGSRRKRSEYMKRRGLIDQADFTPSYIAKEREYKQRQREERTKRDVIEAVMRHDKP